MEVLQKIQLKTDPRRAGPDPVVSDLAYLRTGIVNLYLFGRRGAPNGSWVLIDAGMPGSAARIIRAAEEWTGFGAAPGAIILTHGHFDHVGALEGLLERWNVPVYAHRLELPYLTGRSSYPPPDPTVGGGAMAALARFYPRGPINVGDRVRALPEDGTVPGMPEWRWIHTPGHTPGHVSLFREEDRTLIVGDAFVTTKQESATAVLTQRPELHGPPAYYTPDWESARRSVERLAALEPRQVATGHGPPLQGSEMLANLHELARNFDRLAVPTRGRYVRQPAIADERGVVTVPPAVPDPLPRILLGVGLALVAGAALKRSARNTR
ncbi:MAG TPA: MBL fold metallo-hydrolase [Gemmatimonadales bacterium]|jgi:glyoxylase-like metal-dependent hydrolase (beta-lactamase superfamily II)|nr:MBL fold metallo-hydrolase [Gemmatimonadales bacterium]